MQENNAIFIFHRKPEPSRFLTPCDMHRISNTVKIRILLLHFGSCNSKVAGPCIHNNLNIHFACICSDGQIYVECKFREAIECGFKVTS